MRASAVLSSSVLPGSWPSAEEHRTHCTHRQHEYVYMTIPSLAASRGKWSGAARLDNTLNHNKIATAG